MGWVNTFETFKGEWITISTSFWALITVTIDWVEEEFWGTLFTISGGETVVTVGEITVETGATEDIGKSGGTRGGNTTSKIIVYTVEWDITGITEITRAEFTSITLWDDLKEIVNTYQTLSFIIWVTDTEVFITDLWFIVIVISGVVVGNTEDYK